METFGKGGPFVLRRFAEETFYRRNEETFCPRDVSYGDFFM
jgi:hypothetical protein